jgi:Cu(I)-responsive transcriptional regulator
VNISQAAKAVGLTAKALRHYESIGLLQPAQRADNGYREYGELEITQLRFVQRARSNGFSLEECRELLAHFHDPERQSAHVKMLVMHRVEAVDEEITRLQMERKNLLAMAHLCAGDESPHCAIIDTLAGTNNDNKSDGGRL